MKRRMRKIGAMFLAVLLLVTLNINPTVVIAQAIIDSHVFENIKVIHQNLVRLASNGTLSTVYAGEPSTTPDINVTVYCDHSDEIDDLMGLGDVTLTDLKLSGIKNAIEIRGTIEEGDAQIVSAIGDVNQTLQGLSGQLSQIQHTIELMQHNYRVAHLYSLNNEDSGSLWRPYTEDVPYVSDFAMVSGPFANVYTGYWDTAVTTLYKPQSAKAERALEVLGYDAIVRYEGVVLQRSVSAKHVSGMGEQSTVYGPLDGNDTSSAWTIATVEREEIGVESVTWLDAVTLLYKALGQEQYTYQSFMSRNPSITPETSPAFQNLANPVPGADGQYQGYDFKMFLSRSNIVSGTSGSSKQTPIYWNKAVSDGFIPVGVSLDDAIIGTDFLKLAWKMMVAYGEPEMTKDETMALLQVYGTNYPVSLGLDTADAWAYLKVRGCLADDVLYYITKPVSRDELLDVCMRVKDKDSRLNYKDIQISLDIGELLRDNGYYPVKDLDFSIGSFSSSIEIDYSKKTSYAYAVVMSEDMRLSTNGALRAYSDPECTHEIEGFTDPYPTYTIEGTPTLLFTIPVDYTGNIYVCKRDLASGTIITDGAVKTISIPSNLLGGGIFAGSFTLQGDIAVATEQSYNSLDLKIADKVLQEYADFVRAGRERPTPTVASLTATPLEKLSLYMDALTSPMVAYAAPTTNLMVADGGSGSSTVKVSHTASWEKLEGNDGKIGNLSALPLTADQIPDGQDVSLFDTSSQSPYIMVAADPSSLLYSRMYHMTNWITSNNSPVRAMTSGVTVPSNVGSSSATLTVNQSSKAGAAGVLGVLLRRGNYTDTTIPGYVDTQRLSLYAGINEEELKLASDMRTLSSNTQDHDPRHMGEPDKWLPMYAFGAEPHTNISALLQTNDSFTSSNSWARGVLVNGDLNTAVNGKVSTAIQNFGLSATSYDSASDTFEFTVSSSKSRDFEDMLGAFADENNSSSSSTNSQSDIVNIQRDVASSVVMSRNEEKLLSWESLLKAQIVEPVTGGGFPQQEADGCYYIWTKFGQVKVNTLRATIQIGTTIYDLHGSIEGGKDPLLAYMDNSDDNKMFYLDVRCVMGIVQNEFIRTDNTLTIETNSIGSGNYVIYDIGANGTSSNVFDVVEVGSYNFPEVKGLSYLSNLGLGSNAPAFGSNSARINLLKSTIYDSEYWTDNSYNRIVLNSFVPTANWLVVINQSETDTGASLFVYYPKAPFAYGFANEAGSISTVSEPSEYAQSGWNNAIQESKALPKLYEALRSCYCPNNEEEPVEWYDKMSWAAATHLYQMTELWYLSPNYVIREFKLTSNTVNNVFAYDNFGDPVTKEIVDASNTEVKNYEYADEGKADGAMYWLESIGFVYNMPTISDFTLEKYLSGQYPLPIAVTSKSVSSASQLGIVNYNMNYWGTWVNKDNQAQDRVPYGYSLDDKGYVHYKDGSVYISSDSLPKQSDNLSDEILPYYPPGYSGDSMVLAPSGVYFYFGGNTKENVPATTVSQSLTTLNEFYYGSSRVTFKSINNDNTASYEMGSTSYYPIKMDNSSTFYRVYRLKNHDVLINNGNILMGGSSSIQDVIVDSYVVEPPDNPLDRLGATTLLRMIDEGASWLIVIAFKIIPIIGIILMTILIGLSFIGQNKVVQTLAEKVIDPVRILTFGARDITNWHFKKVLLPCLLLYITFALFYNGNLIKIVMWLGEVYGVVSKHFKMM